MKTIKKLKPLHVVLAENPEYRINKDGDIFIPGAYFISPGMLEYFGTSKWDTKGNWEDSWFGEVEVKDPLVLRFEDKEDLVDMLELVSCRHDQYVDDRQYLIYSTDVTKEYESKVQND